MASAGQERQWPEPEPVSVKRRKVVGVDQERLTSGWFATTREWSTEDSIESTSTFFDSPASIRQGTPCRADALHALDQRFQGVQQAAFPVSQWLCGAFTPNSQFTPPSQGIILSSQQQAPKLQAQPFSACSLEQAPLTFQPAVHHVRLPTVGTKRLRLDSYSIASQLASGQVTNLEPFCEYMPARQQRLLVPRNQSQPTNHLQLTANTSTSLCPSRGALAGYQASSFIVAPAGPILHSQQSAATLPYPINQHPIISQADRTLTQCQPLQRWPTYISPLPVVQRSLSTPANVLEQWSFALGLLQDTVQLALHMFYRTQRQVLETDMDESALQRGMTLLGCLWVAAKHEECRFGMPGAQKMAALVAHSVQGGVRTCTVNSAELYVLDLLGWQPLKGWDDLHFVKGKLRDVREVSELRWLSCGV